MVFFRVFAGSSFAAFVAVFGVLARQKFRRVRPAVETEGAFRVLILSGHLKFVGSDRHRSGPMWYSLG